ncbi:MAG: hypothetical protein H7A40_00410 [Chlamydiales bacterium]|nr:hypothetical protein [Chlamydiales bacterium]
MVQVPENVMGLFTTGIRYVRSASELVTQLNTVDSALTERDQRMQRIAQAIVCGVVAGLLYVTCYPFVKTIDAIPLIGSTLGLVPKLILNIAMTVLFYSSIANSLPFLAKYQVLYSWVPLFLRDSAIGKMVIPQPILSYHDKQRIAMSDEITQLNGIDQLKGFAKAKLGIEITDGYTNADELKRRLNSAVTKKTSFEQLKERHLFVGRLFEKSSKDEKAKVDYLENYLMWIYVSYSYLEELALLTNAKTIPLKEFTTPQEIPSGLRSILPTDLKEENFILNITFEEMENPVDLIQRVIKV